MSPNPKKPPLPIDVAVDLVSKDRKVVLDCMVPQDALKTYIDRARMQGAAVVKRSSRKRRRSR